MADQNLLNKVHDLSDLELAILICLVAQEHCIIDTDQDSIDELIQELELIAENAFGLSHATIDLSEQTSLDDFAQAILLLEDNPTRSNSPARTRQDSLLYTPPFQPTSRSPLSASFSDSHAIPSIILAKNLDQASKQIQIQALELMRIKRIYTRTSMHSAPKQFLFIAVLADANGPRLAKHLNDYMFISHFHNPEDGFPNLEDLYDDRNSISSVLKKSLTAQPNTPPRISAADIDTLSKLSEHATFAVEVKQYQLNMISFLRLHRAVASGITAAATKHFDKLAKCLAPLHGLSYTTPSLIALAARRIYRHRINVATPENERSMQWGSDIRAVEAVLQGIEPDDIIEDVINKSGLEALL